jgi:NADH:ubiquinone oxidoreductase subunit C
MDLNNIQTKFPNINIETEGVQFPVINVSPEDYYELMKILHENGFDYLFAMTGMDWGAELGVTNHLENTRTREMIVVKVKIEDRENPELETLENIWKTAHLHEREIFDLFGINFKGHSVMKRLLLPDDWEGYPMRKDWMDDTKMIIR